MSEYPASKPTIDLTDIRREAARLALDGLTVERLARAMARLAEVGPPAHLDIALAEEHWESYLTEATDLAAECAALAQQEADHE